MNDNFDWLMVIAIAGMFAWSSYTKLENQILTPAERHIEIMAVAMMVAGLLDQEQNKGEE